MKPYENGKGPTEAKIQESLIGWLDSLPQIVTVDFEQHITLLRPHGPPVLGYLDVVAHFKDRIFIFEVKKDWEDVPGSVRQLQHYSDIIRDLPGYRELPKDFEEKKIVYALAAPGEPSSVWIKHCNQKGIQLFSRKEDGSWSQL